MQTDQLNHLFHTFTDLMNSVGARHSSDWFLPNSFFSPTDDIINNINDSINDINNIIDDIN